MIAHFLALASAAAALAVAPETGLAQATVDLPVVLPAAVVDLRTSAGADLVGARWRYSDVKVVDVEHREPGPDLRPSGAPNQTNDITPHAEPADFDDSAWETIEPAALENRRSHGRLYRIRLGVAGIRPLASLQAASR